MARHRAATPVECARIQTLYRTGGRLRESSALIRRKNVQPKPSTEPSGKEWIAPLHPVGLKALSSELTATARFGTPAKGVSQSHMQAGTNNLLTPKGILP